MANRRDMLKRSVALIGAAALPAARSDARAPGFADPPRDLRPDVGSLAFDIAERHVALPCFDGKSLPLYTFGDGLECFVVRARVGEPLDVVVRNSLPVAGEHVSIHWHGLRIANDQDGVSFLTQKPIEPGAVGRYRFAPPDTGTYFFHTHCNSVEHFGRGLVAALIVESDELAPSDLDLTLMLKDWRLSPERTFLPFTTDQGAAKAGTIGAVRAVNGVTAPRYRVPASADVRLRVLNVDPSRAPEVGIEGAESALIAVDGCGLPPMPFRSWRLGPAGRLDFLLRSPAAGVVVRLVDYFAPTPVVLAEFVSSGDDVRRTEFAPMALRAPRIADADVAAAERLTFTFSATATGTAVAALAGEGHELVGKLCLSKRSFWAINQQSWASMDQPELGPPLARLKLGKSYVFVFENATQHAHPIHVHGHTFKVLSSSLRSVTPHHADTTLVAPKERLEVAFVADNPGRWMLHCHILEHQETGMMGYIEVA